MPSPDDYPDLGREDAALAARIEAIAHRRQLDALGVRRLSHQLVTAGNALVDRCPHLEGLLEFDAAVRQFDIRALRIAEVMDRVADRLMALRGEGVGR